MKDKPFVLIGVNSDKEIARAKKAIADNNLNWRSFTCGEKATSGPIPTAWGVHGWPTLVVMDSEMQVHYRGYDGEEATKVAKQLVAAMTAGGK